jgi:hypothetical protein
MFSVFNVRTHIKPNLSCSSLKVLCLSHRHVRDTQIEYFIHTVVFIVDGLVIYKFDIASAQLTLS